MIRTIIFWRVRLTCARCTIATARRAFSLPITPALVETGRNLPAETLAYVAALAPLVGGDPVNRGVVIAAGPAAWTSAPLFAGMVDHNTSSAYRPLSDGRLPTHPVTDLSGLEPSFGWLLHGRGASLFVADFQRCPALSARD